jgi:hypothetical protein
MHPVSLPAPPPRPHSAAPAALQPKQAAPHGCDSAQPQPGAAGRGPQRQGDTAPGQPLGGRPGGDGPHAQQLRERAARLVAGAFASARGGGGGGPGAAVGGAMAEGMRRQLCDDAMTMLVLWATRQDYDAVGPLGLEGASAGEVGGAKGNVCVARRVLWGFCGCVGVVKGLVLQRRRVAKRWGMGCEREWGVVLGAKGRGRRDART